MNVHWKFDRSFLGGDYQGDILLTTDQLQRGVGKRNPLARWPNGTVPYEISTEYGNIEREKKIFLRKFLDGYDQGKILAGIRRLERVVSLDSTLASFCIRFRPKNRDDKYFLSIQNGDGCSSYVK